VEPVLTLAIASYHPGVVVWPAANAEQFPGIVRVIIVFLVVVSLRHGSGR
jgi:hypothetical protein